MPYRDKEARNAQARRWYLANKEARKATQAASYQRHKHEIAARHRHRSETDPEYRKKCLEKWHKNKLRLKYRLSNEDYQAILESQDGRCAICRTDKTELFVVDHDHATGRVRGILCRHCNLGLGHFHDDEAQIQRALEYLTLCQGLTNVA